METTALEQVRAFRREIYTTLGCRRDALFEILDALLTTSVIEHPVYLGLAPGFQRTWGNIYDALNAGTMPLPVEKLTPARVRRAFSQLLPTLGTRASVPKPCGRLPGRPKGRRSKPTKRFPAVNLTA